MKYNSPAIYLLCLFVSVISCGDDGPRPVVSELADDEFKNPILTSAPDPWVFQKDAWYYFTHTTGNSIRLYRTKSMSDLKNAEAKTIWSPPVSGMNSRNIWAPEIHFVNGKWYFYYAADDGNNSNHRMWVLENESVDPFTGTWVERGELELPDDKWAIDGTIFEHDEQLYFLWSGWEGDADIRQDIYISRMTDPFTAEGERIRISLPELSWEKNGAPPAVNEGPQFMRHGDRLFVFFSASGCWTDQYSIGLLYADAAADPMDPSAWTKAPEPLFTTNASGQAFGPGHNSFFKSPDGSEDWIIYHANPGAGMGCGKSRSLRIQRYTWTEEGFPDLGNPVALNTVLKKPAGDEQ